MLQLIGKNCCVKSAESMDGDDANILMCAVSNSELCPKSIHKLDLEAWCVSHHI